MYPAPSIIIFTVFSGIGFGVLAVLGLCQSLLEKPLAGGLVVVVGLVAMGLVVAGLAASAFHLGRPERAWRAFSQWRSSWLSREGLASALTVLAGAVFIWQSSPFGAGHVAVAGIVVATLSLVTVYATGMIYASLRAIPAWYSPMVPVIYVVLALVAGLLVLSAVGGPPFDQAAPAGLVVAGALKLWYWRHIDHPPAAETAGSATGLGDDARVSLLEAPHDNANYLLREMGFRVARKHAARLRRLALWGGFLLPAGLLLGRGLLAGETLSATVSIAASGLFVLGLLVERWLFFAEARHVQGLYYGLEM